MKRHPEHHALERVLERALKGTARRVLIAQRAPRVPLEPEALYQALAGVPGCGAGRWTALTQPEAHAVVVRMLTHSLAYRVRRMERADAAALADRVLAVLGVGGQCWSNARLVDGELGSWNPATQATFDLGIVAAGEDVALLLWVEDED